MTLYRYPKDYNIFLLFLDIVSRSQQDSLIYNGLMQKTMLLGRSKMLDSAVFYSHRLYDLASKNLDTIYMIKASIKLGIYHKNNNEYTKAFQYHNEAFKISRLFNDSLGAGKSLLQMSNIQDMLGDYLGSKTTATDGLRYVENTSDLRSLSGLYHIISVANRQQKNYEEAFRYNKLALALNTDSVSQKKNGAKNVLIFKNTQANILADLEKYTEAISIFSKLVSDSIIQKDKREYARVLGNLGYVQWLQDKHNKNSEALLLNALKINQEINDVEGLIASNIYLTKFYFEKDKIKALKHAEATYQSAKKMRNLILILEALGFVFKLKEDVVEEARVYDKVHHQLQEINQSNREIYAITKYENEKLTTENVVLRVENNKKAIKVLVISLLLAISLGGVGYYYYKQYLYKKRFLQLLDAKTIKNGKPSINKDKNTITPAISQEALEHLLTQLELFEQKEGYLKTNINAKDLAKSFDSNSSYLSMVVNTYKEKSFSQYINDLRIDFAIKRLRSDATFRKYTIKAIAQELGFNSSESFAKKFYKKTGIYPSYFVKKLEE